MYSFTQNRFMGKGVSNDFIGGGLAAISWDRGVSSDFMGEGVSSGITGDGG